MPAKNHLKVEPNCSIIYERQGMYLLSQTTKLPKLERVRKARDNTLGLLEKTYQQEALRSRTVSPILSH